MHLISSNANWSESQIFKWTKRFAFFACFFVFCCQLILIIPPQNPLFLAEKRARESKVDRPGSRFSQAEQPNGILPSSSHSKKPKRSAIEELMAEEEYLKEKTNRKNYWLTPGIEVKLIYRKLPQHLRYCHAAVVDMEDDYTVRNLISCCICK